jgi:hypothetical protein
LEVAIQFNQYIDTFKRLGVFFGFDGLDRSPHLRMRRRLIK